MEEVDRLQGMISDLLDINSFSAGAIPVREEWVNMNELIRDITRKWEQTQMDKSFDLSLSLPSDEIEASRLRIQQILINLLNNER